nr:MAG TPA: hypothetical protein [Caudoviricetes sp.]
MVSTAYTPPYFMYPQAHPPDAMPASSKKDFK